MDFEKLRAVLEAEAIAQGLEEYEIYFTSSQSISTEALGSEISSFASGTGAGVCFRCIVGGHIGSASTEFLEESELKALVGKASANAAVIESDSPAIIYSGSKNYKKAENNFPKMQTAAEAKALALELQKMTYSESELITDGTQAGVFAEIGHYELANSKGVRLSNTISVNGTFVQAVVNKNGEAQEAFDFCLDCKKANALSHKTVNEAISKLGAEEIPSGKYKIAIDGRQMRALLSTFAPVFSGKNALLGLSLLSQKEGERVASECVTIVDDPMYDGMTVATPFDGEGVATYKKNVIENGVLTTLLYDLAYAQKAGKTTTANGQRGSYASQVGIAPFCFYIKEGSVSDERLLEILGDGLYITELKGLHAGADNVTGDFSIESAGFTVKNGKLEKAVKGFTIAGNFFDLLKSIEAVSDNVKFGMPSGFTVFGSPDVIVGEMSVAGI